MQDLKTQYNLLVKELEKQEVPCTVNLLKNEIIIETGRNCPDSVDDAIYTATRKLGLKWGSDVSSCAKATGFDMLESERIRGNPKKYN